MNTRVLSSLHVMTQLLSLPLILALLAPASTLAQDKPAPEAPPPRTVTDIVRVLDQHKPDSEAIARARATMKLPPPATQDRAELFKYYYERSQAALRLSDANETIDSLRKARDNAVPGEARALSNILQRLAVSEYLGGNILNALEATRQRKASLTTDIGGAAISANSAAAEIFAAVGDFDAARQALRESEAVFQRVSRGRNAASFRHLWLSYVEQTRAEVFFSEGKLVEAEAAFRKALNELEQDEPDRKQRVSGGLAPNLDETNEAQRAAVLRRQTRVLLGLGRLGEAEIAIRAALKLSLERAGRDSPATVAALQSLAFTLLEQGRYAEATLIAREALKGVEASGARPESFAAVNARKALGAALVANGDWDGAIASFEALRGSLASDPKLAARLGSGDLDWAHALLKKQRGADARAMLEPMLDQSTKQYGERDIRTAQIRGFHAVALERTGARQQALAEFAKAVPVLIEQARNDIAADTGSVRQMRRLTLILENYIELLARTRAAGIAVPGIDPVAESFRIADVARGSEVQRALSASAARTNISDPALADLARREQDAQRRINSLGDILKSLLAAPPDQQLPSIIAQMRKDIEGLTKERTAIKAQIEKRFPDYADLVDPKPASIAQVQGALRAGETLISIYLGEDAAFVWAVPKSGAAAFATAALGMDAIGKTVDTLRKALDPAATSIDEIPAFDVALAADLYRQLLAPVESTWRGKSQHLLLVPHGPLGQLPLGLLPLSAPTLTKGAVPFEEYRGVPWLIREASLTQLPSVNALATLRRTPLPKGERRMYLGIGDPFFSKEQAADATKLASAAPAGATRGIPVHLRSAPKTDGVSSAELALLPRLPDTESELVEIAKALGADLSKDVILHREANEASVKKMNLADRRIVHFATHGLVPGELDGLTQPALALSAPEVSGTEGDGLLTMDEVLALKLNADWVVLSACNTASGAGAGSEAVSGLGRAFFYAGARALLVSNWPVDSASARVLMTDIFRRYAAAAPTAKAESLRGAMLALIDGAGAVDAATGRSSYSYAHPLFWAPFVLVGD